MNSKIYVISGKARHGKDTVAKYIKEYYKDKKVIILQFSTDLKKYAMKINNWDGSDETKPRELLQTLGTNVIRKQIDPLFFVKRVIGDIKVYSFYFDVIIISDARTIEEVDNIKNNFKNVTTIRVNRPNFVSGLTKEQLNHFTETNLDNYPDFDLHIENDGTEEQLKEKIDKLLGGMK